MTNFIGSSLSSSGRAPKRWVFIFIDIIVLNSGNLGQPGLIGLIGLIACISLPTVTVVVINPVKFPHLSTILIIYIAGRT